MRLCYLKSGVCAAVQAAALIGVSPALHAQEPSPAPAASEPIEEAFDRLIDREEMREWLRRMSAEPNHIGSPHNKANAEWQLAKFREFGWDARIETFDILYPTPLEQSVEILGSPAYRFTLQEPPIPGDSSAAASQPALPAYFAYQGDGDVTAPVVYVNHGLPEDYAALHRMGISVKGKIVFARFGGGFRGLIPRLAHEQGAIGSLVYSDPVGDGYAVESPYPDGPARPPRGIQRGTVLDITRWIGDPLKPEGRAEAGRLTIEQSPIIMKIPAVPVSYADAQELLKSMTGPVAPRHWRGGLPLTYRAGPSAVPVRLKVKSSWNSTTLHNVVATIPGTSQRDEWVLRGNHRDAWGHGAEDPLSGQVALMQEAKAIGALLRGGWRPKRTLVYLSWDGEEAGIVGSAEWASAHAAELKNKAVAYINTDNNSRGFLMPGGTPSLARFVNQVAETVTDPETQVSIGQRLRAKNAVDAVTAGAGTKAIQSLDTAHDFPIRPLGAGSDYSAFVANLGIASLHMRFGGLGGGSRGVYHSRYDTFEHLDRFGDPGLVYSALLAKTVGRMVLRMADAELPLQRATNFAEAIRGYADAAKTLAADGRSSAAALARIQAADVYRLTDDLTLPRNDPPVSPPGPAIDFAPLDSAVVRLEAAARSYDAAFDHGAASLAPEGRARLRQIMLTIEQTLAPARGLPGRPWFKNLIFAPGRYSGYGTKTLPGITEAIEERRWADASAYVGHTANALNAYSARLEQAATLLSPPSAAGEGG